MPHVRENEPRPDEDMPQERTAGPTGKPSGELDGHPVNADETAPREHVPAPGGGKRVREPDAVDAEPGSDL